jgi:DNA-binding Lrp family transcriptional regulator
MDQHLRITNLAPTIQIAVQRMVCTACGAEANASCSCGKPYVPAKERAVEAIKANPQKSNRAIAKETDLSLGTVNNARNELTEQGCSVAEPRIGLDGKKRQPIKRRSMTQMKVATFARSIEQACTACEVVEFAFKEIAIESLPLTADQKTWAERKLMEAIDILKKCLVHVDKAGVT